MFCCGSPSLLMNQIQIADSRHFIRIEFKERRLLPSGVARRMVDMLDARRVDVWIFTGQDWLVRHPDGPYVGLEERTVGFGPTIVDDFGPAFDAAAKIVGVSADFEHLARCEGELRGALGEQASVVRSQPYYLDVTHPLANKGDALIHLARLLKVSLRACDGSSRTPTGFTQLPTSTRCTAAFRLPMRIVGLG
jgi:hydroxymethylpyrimidine pyrophosphatase-like HAD family hydrolase